MLKEGIPFSFMRLITLPLVLTSYQAISRFNNSHFEQELADEVGRLVKLCFTDTNELITLSGTVSQTLAKKIHESESTAVTRRSIGVPSFDEIYTIAKQSMPMYNSGNYSRLAHKAQGFVLSAASQPILQQQVRDLRNSRWWNAGGLFIIMDAGAAIDESCKNAESFLWLAWHYNILSSVFLCHDASERLTIYSYSPYNDMAPKNWLKVGQRLSRGGHPWILLKRYASESPEDCSEAFYDKTKTLNNYTIRTNAVQLSPQLSIDYNKTGLERYTGEDGKLLNCIFNFLNASVEDVPYVGKDPLGFFDSNGTYWGMMGDLFNGRVDFGLNGRYMSITWQLTMSNPYNPAEICFVIKSKGNVPQWINLAFVFDVWVSLGVMLVILLSTAVLSCYSGVSAGCLNGLRLVISAALIRPPSQVPVRLFFSSVFLLLVIAAGLFQGRLVSLLTKPRAYANPETISELVDCGHKVVSYQPFLELIENPVLRSRGETFTSLTCVERLLGGENIICIEDCHVLIYKSKMSNDLHIVRQRLFSSYWVFNSVLDWPLLGRFNKIMRRLVEAGFLGYWRASDMQAVNTHYRTQLLRQNKSPALSLLELSFIFNLLLFGLTIASVVFVFEVMFDRYKIGFRR